MDLELVEHLHHAKRLLSSSSLTTFAQFNLRAGSAATRLQHSPSGGSRRARTPASTSTRPSPLPSRCCHDRSLFHHLDSNVQEVPFEVKEDFVRRAVLLMHAHPMVSKIEDRSFFLQHLISGGGGGSQQSHPVKSKELKTFPSWYFLISVI